MPTLVFSLAIFISSTMLFLVQPMFAKTVLPVLGGAPQVWNTCMVFFQALLLAGYAYAHYSVRALGNGQLVLHFILMLAVLFFLPLEFPVSGVPAETTYPATWLIGQLALFIGLPFFLLSSTAPLLQRWYASVPGNRAGDPYFLYAASNMGSLLALVAYPLIIETQVGLTEQAAVDAGLDVEVKSTDMRSWLSARTYAEDTAFATLMVVGVKPMLCAPNGCPVRPKPQMTSSSMKQMSCLLNNACTFS